MTGQAGIAAPLLPNCENPGFDASLQNMLQPRARKARILLSLGLLVTGALLLTGTFRRAPHPSAAPEGAEATGVAIPGPPWRSSPDAGGNSSSDQKPLVVEPTMQCEKETGSTCILFDCDPYRHAICTRGWGRVSIPVFVGILRVPVPHLWRTCACGEGLCAGAHGTCHDYALPWDLRTSLRGEPLIYIVLLAAFVVGRAGLQRKLPGIRRMAASANFDFAKGWHSSRAELELGAIGAFCCSLVTLLCWHLSQPAFWCLTAYAYGPWMGWWQWGFAMSVLAKELIYLGFIAWGLFMAPQFLLFSPTREQDPEKRLIHALVPELFIAHCITRGEPGIATYIAFLGSFLGLGAAPALIIGLVLDGAMAVPLLFGLTFAFLSWLCS